MALKPKKIYTNTEILSFNEVPVRVAADYLGMTYPMLTWKLQQGEVPFGIARKNREWSYHISPQALVKYKNGEDNSDILRAIHNQLSDIQSQLPEICALLKAYEETKGRDKSPGVPWPGGEAV